MWAYASRLIQRGDSINDNTLKAIINYLRVNGNGENTCSEIPGLLLDLQEQAVAKAQIVGESRRPPPSSSISAAIGSTPFCVIQEAYLELTGLDDANQRGHMNTERERFLNLMGKQIALLQSGKPSAPNPAEAPSWPHHRASVPWKDVCRLNYRCRKFNGTGFSTPGSNRP